MTRTYALLEVTPATYAEVREKFKAAGYDHAFGRDGEIDMHGVALVEKKPVTLLVEEPARLEFSILWGGKEIGRTHEPYEIQKIVAGFVASSELAAEKAKKSK